MKNTLQLANRFVYMGVVNERFHVACVRVRVSPEWQTDVTRNQSNRNPPQKSKPARLIGLTQPFF